MLFTLILLQILQLIQCDQIIQAFALVRHGAREQAYKNLNYDKYKNVFGLLTDVGIRQEYVLGEWLRERYVDQLKLVNIDNLHNDVFVRSTQVNRTIQSAQSLIYGFLRMDADTVNTNISQEKLLAPVPGSKPPNFIQNKEEFWQRKTPIEIYVVPVAQDSFFRSFNQQMCKDINKYKKQNQNTQLYQKAEIYSQKIIQNFSKETGIKLIKYNFWEMHKLQDTLECYLYKGLPLPKNLTQYTWNKMKQLSALAFGLYHYQTREQIDNLSTPFLKYLLEQMEAIQQNQNAHKLYIFSAHDTTLMLFLNALNLTSIQGLADQYFDIQSSKKPQILSTSQFGSSLIFELWRDEINQTYVQILYNGQKTKICSQNQEKCLFRNFRIDLKSRFRNFEQFCGLSQEFKQPLEIPAENLTNVPVLEDANQTNYESLLKSYLLPTTITLIFCSFSWHYLNISMQNRNKPKE